jgi:hypothetical protein
MIRSESRIIIAAIAVFMALAGLAVALHGLVFGEPAHLRYGAAVAFASISAVVIMLDPPPHEW